MDFIRWMAGGEDDGTAPDEGGEHSKAPDEDGEAGCKAPDEGDEAGSAAVAAVAAVAAAAVDADGARPRVAPDEGGDGCQTDAAEASGIAPDSASQGDGDGGDGVTCYGATVADAPARLTVLRDIHPDAGIRRIPSRTRAMPLFELVNAAGETIENTSHEAHEQLIAHWCLRADDCVLEIGGGLGAVSTMIQHVLANKAAHVVVEPQAAMCATLERNKRLHNSEFTIAHGAVSAAAVYSCEVTALDGPDSKSRRQWMYNATRATAGPGRVRVPSLTPEDLRARVAPHGPFSALVVDAEGAFPAMLRAFPDLVDERVRVVYLEADEPGSAAEYREVERALEDSGLSLVLRASKHRVWVRGPAVREAARKTASQASTTAPAARKTAIRASATARTRTGPAGLNDGERKWHGPVQQLEIGTRSVLHTWGSQNAAVKGLGLINEKLRQAIREGSEYGGFEWQFAPAGSSWIWDDSRSKQLEQLDVETRAVLRTWPSAAAAKREYGFEHGPFYTAVQRRRQFGGYLWRYAGSRTSAEAPVVEMVTWLVCDGCEGEVELAHTGLESAPEGEWFCDECRAVSSNPAAARPAASAPGPESVNQVCSETYGGEHDAALRPRPDETVRPRFVRTRTCDVPPASLSRPTTLHEVAVAVVGDESGARVRKARVQVELTLTAPDGTSYLPVVCSSALSDGAYYFTSIPIRAQHGRWCAGTRCRSSLRRARRAFFDRF